MKTTIRFNSDSGAIFTAVFDRDTNTVVSDDGRTGSYSYTDGSSDLVLNTPEGPVTMTFDDVTRAIGHTTRYKTSDGRSGTATLIAMG